MTCTTPLPERLDPPDAASECAVCHRVTEDGRDLELCDEAVDALLDAGAIRRNAAVDTGVQFVCESCLDDLYDAQDVYGAISEAFDTISDALGLDEYEHPALRARKMVQRLQSSTAPDGQPILAEAFADNGAHSHWYLIDPKTGAKVWSEDPEECAARGFSVSSPAPVVGGMPVLPPLDPPTGIRTQDDPVWGMSGDLEAIFKMSGNPLLSAMHHGIWQGYDVARSRLPAIKTGEVDRKRILEEEWCFPGTGVPTAFERCQDDCEGRWEPLKVQFGIDGDAWISTPGGRMLRFRNIHGGGMSPRTHKAIKLLAEAIHLDNQECPFLDGLRAQATTTEKESRR